MGKLDGRAALITGGNSGIGAATAALFAREGAQVMIAARRVEQAEETIAQIREQTGVTVSFTPCDVRSPAACEQAVKAAVRQFGRLDILFNNAGIVPVGTILDTDDETLRAAFETNVYGTFHCSKAALTPMIAQGGGVIINNASDWGMVGGSRAAVYSATKGAVVLLTKSMALDHARQGIRVNAVCPGDTVVERWRSKWNVADDAEFQARLRQLGDVFPLGRVGEVDEIARGVLFLACDDSSYMTGQTLVIDGGNTAGGVSASFGGSG
jgi:NAD(P)-dependent dehydrogenase (short-subunit alcohol dehydrogenase family)